MKTSPLVLAVLFAIVKASDLYQPCSNNDTLNTAIIVQAVQTRVDAANALLTVDIEAYQL